jgi:PAS domain S-box-containing protein
MVESRLASVAHASARIMAARSLEEAVSIGADEARASIGAHQAAISLTFDGDPGHAIHRASLSDKHASWRARGAAPLHSWLHNLVLGGAGPVRLTQAALDTHPARRDALAAPEGPPLCGWLAAPLRGLAQGGCGLIHLTEKCDGEFTPEDEAVLVLLANLILLALESARLRDGSAIALALEASEAQRQASEQRYRNVIDLVQEGIWMHRDGIFLFANPAAARLFGADGPEALIGRSVFSQLHPDDQQRAMERSRIMTYDRVPVPATEMRLLGLDGRTRIVELKGIPFVQGDDLLVITTGRDVTAQREAEARLQQAQKMDVVGQLTGGIAHDFNNLLTVVMGNLDFDPERLPADLRPSVENALHAAERGAALTHRLLAFSRRQTLVAGPVDFNRLATGMEDLLRRTLGEHVEIELRLDRTVWTALADSGQVEDALLNLAVNARDAMPGGGKLTIETGNAHLDEDYAAHNAEVTPGDYAVLAVTDTGVGMAPEVLGRVFEPFFTTKEVGKGTGLGLSMVYGFAKQSRGHVRIYSEVGHGTTVRLYLPRLTGSDPTDRTATADATALSPRPCGGETILVVEDDAQVRAFVLRELRELGYRVLEAEDGPRALRILESGAAIDLLFTDVVMPGGMTGYQLAESGRRRRPSLKTLFTSGYTENSVQRVSNLDPGIRLLSKPYRKHDLATRIRGALDA